jgi:3-deoxy-D-manno-octulosonate 8-phosphate phosphatase (KDO 8-P phosphatase)
MDNRDRASRIKMILMDVDGTLTDGTIFVLPDGEEVALEKRAERLRVNEIHQGILDKMPVLEKIKAEYGLHNREIGYIGDDLGDLSVIKTIGFAGAVADAHPEILRHSHFISHHEGGRGAVREFIEFILEAQDQRWDILEKKIAVLKG